MKLKNPRNALLAFRYAAAEAGSREAAAISLAISAYMATCSPDELLCLSEFTERIGAHLDALEAERKPTP